MVATTAWLTPSVLSLDRVAAATPSGFVAFSYDEDFQGAIGAPSVAWSTTITDTAPADPGRRFLGQFASADSVTLTISLPPHTTVSVGFDLFILKSWDGSNVGRYNDRFEVDIDGVTVFDESFGQYWLRGSRRQTYGPNAVNPAGTGSVEQNTLGYFYGANRADTVYRIEFNDVAHTSTTLTVTFRGVNLQALADESWGLDNVSVVAC